MKIITNRLYVPFVNVESVCGRLEIVPLIKDEKLMIQLLNAGGNHGNDSSASDDYIPPVLDACISIALPQKPKKLVLRPENRSLPFIYKNGRAYIRIDRIDIHNVIDVITK